MRFKATLSQSGKLSNNKTLCEKLNNCVFGQSGDDRDFCEKSLQLMGRFDEPLELAGRSREVLKNLKALALGLK